MIVRLLNGDKPYSNDVVMFTVRTALPGVNGAQVNAIPTPIYRQSVLTPENSGGSYLRFAHPDLKVSEIYVQEDGDSSLAFLSKIYTYSVALRWLPLEVGTVRLRFDGSFSSVQASQRVLDCPPDYLSLPLVG